jgi:hypothetical protein
LTPGFKGDMSRLIACAVLAVAFIAAGAALSAGRASAHDSLTADQSTLTFDTSGADGISLGDAIDDADGELGGADPGMDLPPEDPILPVEDPSDPLPAIPSDPPLITEPLLDPVAPIVDPVLDPEEPVIEPVTDLIEPVVNPPTDPVEPVSEPLQPVEPIVPITDPIVPIPPPVAAPIGPEPIAEPIEPIVEPDPEQIAEPVAPVVQPGIDPVLPIDPITDPIEDPATDLIEPTTEPVTEDVTTITEPILEPVTGDESADDPLLPLPAPQLHPGLPKDDVDKPATFVAETLPPISQPAPAPSTGALIVPATVAENPAYPVYMMRREPRGDPGRTPAVDVLGPSVEPKPLASPAPPGMLRVAAQASAASAVASSDSGGSPHGSPGSVSAALFSDRPCAPPGFRALQLSTARPIRFSVAYPPLIPPA